MAHYGHGDQAIPGVKLLGEERICMVHVKNGKKLLEEPGLIDWAANSAARSAACRSSAAARAAAEPCRRKRSVNVDATVAASSIDP